MGDQIQGLPARGGGMFLSLNARQGALSEGHFHVPHESPPGQHRLPVWCGLTFRSNWLCSSSRPIRWYRAMTSCLSSWGTVACAGESGHTGGCPGSALELPAHSLPATGPPRTPSPWPATPSGAPGPLPARSRPLRPPYLGQLCLQLQYLCHVLLHQVAVPGQVCVLPQHRGH